MTTVFEKFKQHTPVPNSAFGKFKCPQCDGHEFSFAHLLGEEGKRFVTGFGPWYCDSCGFGWHGRVKDLHSKDTIEHFVELKLHTDRKHNTIVLLRLRFAETSTCRPVHILVPGMCFANHDEQPDPIGHSEYFYNEHTCPWNWLRLPIAFGDNTDPHGLFEFVDAILQADIPVELKEEIECNGDSIHFNGSWEEWQLLFPILKNPQTKNLNSAEDWPFAKSKGE